MQWQEPEFHRYADRFMELVFEQVEEQDTEALIDIDFQDGVLLIEAKGMEFVLNKHSASQQIWLSSPLSGGLHFSSADGGKDWKLPDGRRLSVVLSEELSMATGEVFQIEV